MKILAYIVCYLKPADNFNLDGLENGYTRNKDIATIFTKAILLPSSEAKCDCFNKWES